MSKTIIVSNRLPVKVKEFNGSIDLIPSEGGLATGLNTVYKERNNVWVGWPGVEIPDMGVQNDIAQKIAGQNLFPVFLDHEEINNFYEGFCNEILWPVFHYMSTYARYDLAYWNYYQSVNEKYKDAILDIAEPGDIIWVHDYQLLLLPELLKNQLPSVSIGFFQHIPFPSYELFRLIPWRKELLQGMLGADLVGFHTYDDCRHFISSSTRILPVTANANIISTDHGSTVVEAFPMGIDNVKFENLVNDETVKENINILKDTFNGMKVCLSIDRLDYSKGILQRIQAFELLLQENPEYIEQVMLYMVVVPSRDTVQQYKELKDEIDKIVGNINARYRTINWHPIHYFYRSFDIYILSALYQIADICIITPMRDGMNLVSKEYVASRTQNDGVLILSEMAGASKELSDALIVNPNDAVAIKAAIAEALQMPLPEQERRMVPMRQIVSKFNVKHWAKIFMDRLAEVKQLQHSMLAKQVNQNTLLKIKHKYNSAYKRIIFLDYDGTLVGFNVNIYKASPDKELLDILKQLSTIPENKVVLISGRNYNTLEEWFSDLNLDMIAEHGAWHKKSDQGWVNLPELVDTWKKDIYPLLETYSDRTPGSFIEEKSYSLVWHYRKVERGFGELRANELLNNLEYLIRDKRLQILRGNKVIEIKSMEINKGKSALTWLAEDDYDFIMAVGDDHTDEDIFKVLPSDAITIKVGSNISAAAFYVRDHSDIRNLLKELITASHVSER
ncbi:MAG TPA: bifunctional alpha,alpha-trehalose-phosphate synthase (UDP-forming)/trehalose-phosphatase [Sphingobacteriaceae bacterium]